jgi:signal transduction histidine kinase
MLYIARRTGCYRACFLITVILVFLLLFPFLFFTAGGYRSGMPCFFVFAFVFTALMLEGPVRIIMITSEFALYAICCAAAYINPGLVRPFPTELGYVLDVMTGVSVAGLMLLSAVMLYIRIYDDRQKRLEEAGRLKTELFSNVSHEMKTPLTVVSVHIQRAEALYGLGRDDDAEKIRESFEIALDEIMRMSRLVDSSLRLSSLRESSGQDSGRGALDMAAILTNSAEVYRGMMKNNGNTLTEAVPAEMPHVIGNADEISQVISNLLSNANAHTRDGEIRVSAEADNETLTVTIKDSGLGIGPGILARVFDRGVTDGGGSGFGLPICRQIVESHGGEIAIESEPGMGTKVSFSLPVYWEE